MILTLVLNRTEEEGVGLEDLDVLQIELESLLVSVTRRHMLVEDEMEALPKDKKTVLKVLFAFAYAGSLYLLTSIGFCNICRLT